jgi:uncharacterized protein with GYD domain
VERATKEEGAYFMSKFVVRVSYTSGSWARMLKTVDDRTAAVRSLMDSLDGSLQQVYWVADMQSAFALAELPDSTVAAAIAAAMAKTGAFTGVEVHELLTQDQLTEVRQLAGAVAGSYTVPGLASD